MIIAIDVGYSCVKAASASGKRVLFPSVVAPARDLALADLSRNGVGHQVEIQNLAGETRKYFVGELALREGGQAATFTMEREKHLHPNHSVLLLAAARLLDAGAGATLVAGLPVAYYRSQREELARHLMGLHAGVSVDGLPFVRVSFGKVVVYPQAAGALLVVQDLPSSGLVCVLDIGYKTSDYVTAEIVNGQVRPVSTLCGSLETGVFAAEEMLAGFYQAKTGTPISPARLPGILRNGKAYFRGKEIDFSGEAKNAREAVAQTITDHLLANLGGRADEVARFYLAGGGAEALPELEKMLPGAVKLPEAQWANVSGFLKVVGC
ncbi:MAG: ParM/StbA family protein [Moorella sp. (in: Bacteria)]|nr:ParM/StbA family protein [Moorella sp. (in: firmicutes)]